jgi:hypothetical protein
LTWNWYECIQGLQATEVLISRLFGADLYAETG